ncbi:hypothetical protein GCM10010446_36060 [Streptomyces enissocaesilis]|uniref:Uncharacterized protein n=1 Tax=Streptomyces enissocaesilis TaxID=332589 RepID=A0ABP6JU28_9ACTN
MERLTVRDVRRARGSDGDTVPGSRHIAEPDGAGTPVRRAAAPAGPTRTVREPGSAQAPADTAGPRAPDRHRWP